MIRLHRVLNGSGTLLHILMVDSFCLPNASNIGQPNYFPEGQGKFHVVYRHITSFDTGDPLSLHLLPSMHKLVITSERVQLYAYEEPVPATIEISDTGKISNVILRKSSQSDYQTTAVEFMDLRDLVVLPGLVELVSPTTQCRS